MRGRLGRRLVPAAVACASAFAFTFVSPGADGPAAWGAIPESVAASLAAMPPARAEMLVDLDTGKVLMGESDHTLLYPGSLTKMLTALVAVNWLAPTVAIPVNSVTAKAYPDNVGMKPGQHWSLSNALHALLIVSANDAAYALAQQVSGSLQGFAATMSLAATELGMTDHPVLHDPAGLDGSEGYDGGNLMSAWDVAIAARDLLANPTLRPIVATKTYSFEEGGEYYSLANYNDFLTEYPGAVGVKTGLTDRAGFCVAEAAERDGRTMLAVVMNGENSYQTAAMLLDQGFATPVSEEAADLPTLPAAAQPYPPAPPVAADPAPPAQGSGGARLADAHTPTGASSDVVVWLLGWAGVAVGLGVCGRLMLRRRAMLRRRVFHRGAHSRRR